ncbi:MAG TPA: hypothetical protein VH518_03915 [Tepidisphaeraceae bacterium]|jgi:hypothetical protein
MLEIETQPTDAPEFIQLLKDTLRRELKECLAEQCYLVQVDHAFDFRWLGFSGNIGAQHPVWRSELTVPPFHPNRIVSQRHFVRDRLTGSYESDGRGRELHIHVAGDAKLRRRIADITDSALFVWYSGATATSDRGSIMLYFVLPSFRGGWFATVTAASNWKIAKTRSIEATPAIP